MLDNDPVSLFTYYFYDTGVLEQFSDNFFVLRAEAHNRRPGYCFAVASCPSVPFGVNLDTTGMRRSLKDDSAILSGNRISTGQNGAPL